MATAEDLDSHLATLYAQAHGSSAKVLQDRLRKEPQRQRTTSARRRQVKRACDDVTSGAGLALKLLRHASVGPALAGLLNHLRTLVFPSDSDLCELPSSSSSSSASKIHGALCQEEGARLAVQALEECGRSIEQRRCVGGVGGIEVIIEQAVDEAAAACRSRLQKRVTSLLQDELAAHLVRIRALAKAEAAHLATEVPDNSCRKNGGSVDTVEYCASTVHLARAEPRATDSDYEAESDIPDDQTDQADSNSDSSCKEGSRASHDGDEDEYDDEDDEDPASAEALFPGLAVPAWRVPDAGVQPEARSVGQEDATADAQSPLDSLDDLLDEISLAHALSATCCLDGDVAAQHEKYAATSTDRKENLEVCD
eukprot:TRINITY_DN52115_c0_g1_i1.p1 TRINITY_DN52115_c0_g1~~TRINITY_DN52115_c0_g1_i1.p1  ORF type:complete len:368 (-),score=69.39 TRINITY_DN52115_c0_g1_i1:154-1257(-)